MKDFEPAKLDKNGTMAVHAWNMMQGINWDALPFVVEYIQCRDVESLIRGLLQIREHADKVAEARRHNG